MVVVCSENEGNFGMLTVMSITRLPTLEMHWSVNNANFALQYEINEWEEVKDKNWVLS